mmetsp:Transcript_10201/g.16443  ORF Transcript_10201/g.16443 Transcript_10201/m.16443 type:complete len:103 (+) Transcript_10201:548-856(+)
MLGPSSIDSDMKLFIASVCGPSSDIPLWMAGGGAFLVPKSFRKISAQAAERESPKNDPTSSPTNAAAICSWFRQIETKEVIVTNQASAIVGRGSTCEFASDD